MAKLFVGNIPHTSSEAELQRWVESQGFHVESAQIIRDRSTGKSRGFGFVALNEEWTLTEAIAALNAVLRRMRKSPCEHTRFIKHGALRTGWTSMTGFKRSEN